MSEFDDLEEINLRVDAGTKSAKLNRHNTKNGKHLNALRASRPQWKRQLWAIHGNRAAAKKRAAK